MKASTAPGAAEAAKMSAATAGRRRSLLEPEGTLYDGQGNVVQVQLLSLCRSMSAFT